MKFNRKIKMMINDVCAFGFKRIFSKESIIYNKPFRMENP
jgi:hypothetical protein